MKKRFISGILILCLFCTIPFSLASAYAETQVPTAESTSGIPSDWKLLAEDNFDVSSPTPVADYTGGTGFSSKWSSDPSCTNQTEDSFKNQRPGKASAPSIKLNEGNGYLARQIGNGSNQHQSMYRTMSEPVDLTKDAEYYMMFDFYPCAGGSYGSSQLLSLADNTNNLYQDGGFDFPQNQVTVGVQPEPAIGKAVPVIQSGKWAFPNPKGKPAVSQTASQLVPQSATYTAAVQISARATGKDIIRYRIFYNPAEEEAPSFSPNYWTVTYAQDLSYNNLNTLYYMGSNGTGTGYQLTLDNFKLYKSAPVKVTSSAPAENNLVAGRTLTLESLPAVNAIGNPQELQSVKWYNLSETGSIEALGNPLAESASFTIPSELTGQRLLCLVEVRDLTTNMVTTYQPVNQYVHMELDLQAVTWTNDNGRSGINPEKLSSVNPVSCRFDLMRHSDMLKTGYIKTAIVQYSELGEQKALYKTSPSFIKVTDIPLNGVKRFVTTFATKDGDTPRYAPGDRYEVFAKYIPGATSDDISIFDDENSSDLTFGAEVINTEYKQMNVEIPGGTQVVFPKTWRSSLYPTDWQPGYKDSQGRFLQDFSYAGYHKGEKPVPVNPPGEIYNVVTGFGADPTGASDSTAAIQNAINTAGEAGGGTVYLPEGTYSLSLQEGTDYCLRMDKSCVVLKGDGKDKTRLYVNETYMREKNVIYMGGPIWYNADNTAGVKATQDILEPTKEIHVESVDGFQVGDWVSVGGNKRVTEAFAEEHYCAGENGTWANAIDSVIFFRQIEAIDPVNKIITIDIPTRYYIKVRDNARVYKPASPIQEQGLQDFSIGCRENTKNGLGENDWKSNGTCGYDTHYAQLILMRGVANGWISNVSTYVPDNNPNGTAMHSNGIRLHQSCRITIKNVDMSKARYQGGAGNGYGFAMEGSDCLLDNCSASMDRHGFSFKSMQTTGNVLKDCQSLENKYVDDFHQHLSTSNLIEGHYMHSDKTDGSTRPWFEAQNRGKDYGSQGPHWLSTSQSVFWNCKNKVISRQFGMGYAIGCDQVESAIGPTDVTAPADFVEGTKLGTGLIPQSLYTDQLNRRIGTATAVIQSLYFADSNNARQNDQGLSQTDVSVKALISYKDSGDAKPPVLIAALYENVEGTEILRQTVSDLEPNENYVYETDYFDLSACDPANCFIRVYVWNGTDTMVPLIEKPILFDKEGLHNIS